MKMMLKVGVPAEAGTQAIKNGSMVAALEHTIEQLKPEAAYFFPDEGQRCAHFVFEMQNQSDIVPTLEPFWMNLDADVSLVPVMNFDDLKAGLARI